MLSEAFINKFKNLITNFAFILIVFSIYFLAYAPVIYRYLNPYPGRVYLGFSAAANDMLGNLAHIQMGFNGKFLSTAISTTAIPSPQRIVKTEYLLLGHFARITGLTVIQTLYLSIFIVSLVYILIIWKLTAKFVTNYYFRILTLFFCLYGTGIILDPIRSVWGIISIPETLVFQRIVQIQPHYAISAILMFISVLYLSLVLEHKGNIKLNFIVAAISGLLAMQIFMTPVLILVLGIIFYCLIKFIQKGLIFFRTDLPVLISYLMIIALPLLGFWYMSQFFDMNMLARSERVIPKPFLGIPDYFYFMGILMIPALLGIFRTIKLKKPIFLLFAGWLIAHGILILLSLYFNITISQIRLIQTPYFVILGLFAGMGIEMAAKFIFRVTKIKIIAVSFILLFIGLSIVVSFPVYKRSLTAMINIGEYDNPDYGMPKTSEYLAMTWLSKKCRPGDRVLSAPSRGTVLGGLTPCTPYQTDWLNSMKIFLDEIIFPTGHFYGNFYSNVEAKKFLNDNKIKFVYYGEEERNITTGVGISYWEPFSLLTRIYDKNGITIYSTDTGK